MGNSCDPLELVFRFGRTLWGRWSRVSVNREEPGDAGGTNSCCPCLVLGEGGQIWWGRERSCCDHLLHLGKIPAVAWFFWFQFLLELRRWDLIRVTSLIETSFPRMAQQISLVPHSFWKNCCKHKLPAGINTCQWWLITLGGWETIQEITRLQSLCRVVWHFQRAGTHRVRLGLCPAQTRLFVVLCPAAHTVWGHYNNLGAL